MIYNDRSTPVPLGKQEEELETKPTRSKTANLATPRLSCVDTEKQAQRQLSGRSISAQRLERVPKDWEYLNPIPREKEKEPTVAEKFFAKNGWIKLETHDTLNAKAASIATTLSLSQTDLQSHPIENIKEHDIENTFRSFGDMTPKRTAEYILMNGAPLDPKGTKAWEGAPGLCAFLRADLSSLALQAASFSAFVHADSKLREHFPKLYQIAQLGEPQLKYYPKEITQLEFVYDSQTGNFSTTQVKTFKVTRSPLAPRKEKVEDEGYIKDEKIGSMQIRWTISGNDQKNEYTGSLGIGPLLFDESISIELKKKVLKLAQATQKPRKA